MGEEDKDFLGKRRPNHSSHADHPSTTDVSLIVTDTLRDFPTYHHVARASAVLGFRAPST